MFRIRKVTLAVLIITITLLTLLFYAQKEAKNVRRDPRVLMDRYYLLQHTNPAAAKAALTIILRQDAHYCSINIQFWDKLISVFCELYQY